MNDISIDLKESRKNQMDFRVPHEIIAKFQDYSYVTYIKSASLYAMAKLKVGQALGFDLNCKKSAKEIAEMIGADCDYLCRTMHFLAVNGCFIEIPNLDGVFKHNEISLALADPTVCDEILLSNGIVHYRSFETLHESILTGKSKSGKALNSRDIWEFYDNNKDKEVAFSRAMTAKTQRLTPSLIELGDYSKFETVCDVGGSEGILISDILKAYPTIKNGINFDLPEVIRENESKSKIRDKRYSECKGSFFESVPVADCYILKTIFHSWNDQKSQEILRKIGESIKPNGKVHIIELLNQDNNHQENDKYIAAMDMIMLQISDGRERSLKQWEELVRDSEFKIEEVKKPKLLHCTNIIVLSKK